MDPRVAAILARGQAPAPTIQVQPTNGMDWVVQRVLQSKPEVESEIQRIVNLRIAEPIEDDEVDMLQRMHVWPEAYDKGFRLQRVQVEALQFFIETGGLFAPIQVGGGKTLISLRCVGIAVEQGIDRICLFVPPSVYNQLTSHDINWARQRVPIGTNFHLMGGKNAQRRRELAGGRRGCWVIPYSLLSVKDSSELLDRIKPQLMIFDEAHHLKNRDSARTKRIRTYYRQNRPKCVALSGTMTAKSLNDYAHIITMCLGEGAPVPLEANMVQEWAAALDSEQAGTMEYHKPKTSAGPLRPLINWSNNNFPQTKLEHSTIGFRQAYQNRLLTTPGVVSSPPDALGTSLIIANRQADAMSKPGGAKLAELQQQLNDLWVSPCGDEIDHAMHLWKWNYELSSGIYNALVWPDPGQVSERCKISVAEASERLERSKSFHIAENDYHKALRHWFSTHPHKPGIDTPMLVGGSMARYGARDVGQVLYSAWRRKEEMKFPERIERDSIPVRVCSYKVDEAVQWVAENGEGIVWFFHNDFGQWLMEHLPNAVFCPAGKKANDFLTGEGAAERCRGKVLVCSLAAHYQGKNLQFMQNQLFAQLPINEMMMEQGIGRTHRKGQTADEVVITTLISNMHDKVALGAILNDAVYVSETMNQPQKVLVATWDPMPTTYGHDVLTRAGAQAKLLTARQQLLLKERFNLEKEKE